MGWCWAPKRAWIETLAQAKFSPVFFLLKIVRQRVCRHSRQLLLPPPFLRPPPPLDQPQGWQREWRHDAARTSETDIAK